MLYAINRSYGMACQDSCLSTSNALLVRTDGLVTHEWTARGALSVLYTPDGNVSRGGASLITSGYPAGLFTLTYTFVPPRDPQRSGGATINRDDSLHTALLAAALGW
jgi:hypothetical protein